MDVFAQDERIMSMDEVTWQRHASPWSVWTRFLTCVPLIRLATRSGCGCDSLRKRAHARFASLS
ncbi:MAG: DUF6653 family protein [Planctomycetota bacterium]